MPDLTPLYVLAALALGTYLAQWANARIARILPEDKIAEPWRHAIKQRFGYKHWVVSLTTCPWCLGWWTAIPVSALAWFPVAGLHYWWLYPLAFLAVAHAGGRLNHSHAPIARS